MIRRLIIDLKAYQIHRFVHAIKSNAEGSNLIKRDADIARQQIAGAGRDQAEGNPGMRQPGTDHADCAIAAGTEHKIDVLAYGLLRHCSTGIITRGL